jgi:hypothetical protein
MCMNMAVKDEERIAHLIYGSELSYMFQWKYILYETN